MPKVTILEKDLTTAAAPEITTNAVYIPGYAVTGPVNEPILFRSLSEFRKVFGSKAYVFKNNVAYSDCGFSAYSALSSSTIVAKGDKENSFTEAIELINKGLPVYYERVYTGDAEADRAHLKQVVEEGTGIVVPFDIFAKYPGI